MHRRTCVDIWSHIDIMALLHTCIKTYRHIDTDISSYRYRGLVAYPSKDRHEHLRNTCTRAMYTYIATRRHEHTHTNTYLETYSHAGKHKSAHVHMHAHTCTCIHFAARAPSSKVIAARCADDFAAAHTCSFKTCLLCRSGGLWHIS